METISLKMEPELLKKIDINLKKNDYSTRTEFIREAIRNRLKELENEEIIRKLTELKGSLKGKAKMSYEQAREIAASNIIKKFKLN